MAGSRDSVIPGFEEHTRVSEPVAPCNGEKKAVESPGPPNLGKAIRLTTPNFNDPNRPPTCLEIDFPIAPINVLSQLEGNAGKPVYQMSKWWARRRSSIFRAMLIAAAAQAPKDPEEAAKLVWDHYYCNHQKAGSFRKLRVLDCFMGGGVTLVEGSRLGFQMTGVDLNPVAWFVSKNELACSDPEQVKALFDHIEEQVKPQVQPFYTTTCPRGHAGRWIDNETGNEAKLDPIDLPPEKRGRYRWEGPEIIYTFWAKHGPCQTIGCRHRTPIFRTPVIAEKKLSAEHIEMTCPECGHAFHAELGETRMAPSAERIVLESEESFTEISQSFAMMLKQYDTGNGAGKLERVGTLLELVDEEPGFRCPGCQRFAGGQLKSVLERHSRASRASGIKKKDLRIRRRAVQMFLLIHPKWLEGASGFEGDREIGGYAGAPPQDTAEWFERRLANLQFIEVRGAVLPDEVKAANNTRVNTNTGTVPQRSEFRCAACGAQQDILAAVRPTKHTPPASVYALQCHCPQCEADGYNYGGRYFKTLDWQDAQRLSKAEHEWVARNESDLAPFWPRSELFVSYMTHKLNGGIPNWGYTHWWKLFNSRQLLVHACILRTLSAASGENWALDVREQALGAFQQYLRMMCMLSFWHMTYDKLAPALSNANFHPKQNVVEVNFAGRLGYGTFASCTATVLEALGWCVDPWELAVNESGTAAKSMKVTPRDALVPGQQLLCTSSTDLKDSRSESYDLVITDPPFGNNLFYADLADFFYVWLRLPLLQWYSGSQEHAYFESERTPHAMEAVDNDIEHPDDRNPWETGRFLRADQVATVREITGDSAIAEGDLNPIFRPEPASDFYKQTLTACWAEARRLLKPGGLMAFTFHHSEDAPWVDVLEALFNAGYILIATYPIRSDETKGESGAFGSRKIEYDIIHVCRKRLEQPTPVSWARMRRWVKDEVLRLKELLEHSHGKDLTEADLRVILRGKSLEFYSSHYGQVYSGANELLGVRDALLGINQLLDDLLEEAAAGVKQRPPEEAEPASRLFLRIFQGLTELSRDSLGKTLRGTGMSQADLEAKGWVRAVGTTTHVVPIAERFEYFRTPGRTRRVLKTDIDQAQFLIGAARAGSGINIDAELDAATWNVKKSVDAVLLWFGRVDPDKENREAAGRALQILQHWRTKPKPPERVQLSIFDKLEAEEG
jgi:hypothetical protein